MSKALRVVFLEDDSTAYVECPVCLVGGRERNYCWWCEGLEWEKACNWEWNLSVPGNVEELGGSEKTVEKVRDLTVVCPAWLDPKTGERRPDSVIPSRDMMYLDKEVGGFTSAPQADRPARNGLMEFLGCCADESGDPMEGCGQATRIGGLEAEVAQLRAKLAEAEATNEQLRSPRAGVAFEWHPCPICGHDTKHIAMGLFGDGAPSARCAVCGVAHEVTP
jgi:hypothetical protein